VGAVTTLPDLEGWIPIRLYREEGRHLVDWCYLGTRRFREPFFEQTVEQCLHLPFNLLFRRQTPVEVLADWQAARPGLEPTGLIFQMSRCGSTLVAQLLAVLPQNVVLSEANPIDEAIRAPGHVGDEQRVAWLRGVVSALGQRRRPEDRHLFIKFDVWHTLDLPLLERAFPGVPWVFLYRDPVEVLVSHLTNRGRHTVPSLVSPAIFGIEGDAALRMSAEEYTARVLGRICQAALDRRQQTGRGLLVNYAQLPEAVWTTMADLFGTAYSAEDRERMRQAARFDAKNPCLFFAADTTDKECRATAAVRRAADTWVRPVYDRLEALREAGGGSNAGAAGPRKDIKTWPKNN
jgi:hypothetical protein